MVGTHADHQVIYQNRGDTAVSVGTASFTGAGASSYGVVDDLCAGQSIAAGASCTFSIRFQPVSTGTKDAHLVQTVSTDVGRRDRAGSRGWAGTASTLTLTGPTGPIFPPDAMTITAHVSPIPEPSPYLGTVYFTVDAGPYATSADVAADGTAVFTPYAMAPGPHEITASYNGGGAQLLLGLHG